jgi:hypothetical protein
MKYEVGRPLRAAQLLGTKELLMDGLLARVGLNEAEQ